MSFGKFHLFYGKLQNSEIMLNNFFVGDWGSDIFKVHFFGFVAWNGLFDDWRGFALWASSRRKQQISFEVKNEAPLQREIEPARLKGTYA
jgi:hypothetical protein